MKKINFIANKGRMALFSLTILFAGSFHSQAQIGKEELPDLDPAVYKSYLNEKLKTVKGYAFYLTKDGNYITSDAKGIARTAQDNNGVSLAYNENTMQEIASVSKMITAVAMLRVIEKSPAVTVDSPIGPWLPKGWKPSASFAALTFKQLLAHKSGLRTVPGLTGPGYENLLEKQAKLAIHPDSQKIRSYWNANYQLMRIVIPNIINATHKSNDANWATQLKNNQITVTQYNDKIAASGSAIYRNYVMDYLFKPSGITAPTCNPIGVPNLAWAYEFKNSTGGSPGKDHSLYCSSGFWQVSAKDLAVLMTKVMHSEDIISHATKAIINNTVAPDRVGWSYKAKRGNGYTYGHGGDVNWGLPEVHSYLLYLPGNYVAYVHVNSSELGSDPLRILLLEAYDAARKFPYNCANAGSTYQFPNASMAGHISKVKFGGINQSSGRSTGYTFFNNYITSFKQDSSYTISLQSAFGTKPGGIYWAVWIDYNRNNTFEANERVVNLKSTSGLEVKKTITIPASALLGNTRMRVAMKRHDAENIASACASFAFGEVEDYHLDITKPCGLVTNLKAVNISSTGAQLTFTKPVDKFTQFIIRYEQTGTNNWNYASIKVTGEASVVYQLLNLKSNTAYRWSVRSDCGDYGAFQNFKTQDNTICGTDIHEGNHNSINAKNIAMGQTITALICSNTLEADQDWYKFQVSSNTLAGAKVSIDLSALPSDYDLYLHTGDSRPIASSATRGNSNEVIEKILTPGTYYARVVGYAGAENTQLYYKLSVKQTDEITMLQNSSLREDNNSELAVYPNPVSGEVLTVDFGQPLEEGKNHQFKLIKAMGTEVHPSFMILPAEGQIRINTSGLEKGIYTLKIWWGTTVVNKQISVQ